MMAHARRSARQARRLGGAALGGGDGGRQARRSAAGARSGVGARPALRRRGSACPTTPRPPTSASLRATSPNEDAQIALVQLYSVQRALAGSALAARGQEGSARSTPRRGCRCSIRSAISTRACSTTSRRRRATTSRCWRSIPARSAPSARSSGSTRRTRTGARSTSCWRGAFPSPDGLARRSGTPESRAHLTFRRAELHANRLDDPHGAADLFEAGAVDRARATRARARGSRR